MGERFVTVLVGAALAAFLTAGAAWAQDGPTQDPGVAGTSEGFVPGEIVVKDAEGYSVEPVEARSLGALKEAARAAEARDQGVEEAGPNYLYRPEFAPDDPLYATSQPWLKGGSSGIRATGAWDQSKGGNVAVGVVDTGWRRDHPDLVAPVAAERDFLAASPDATANDNWYHGTSVAGIIGADSNNGRGVASVGFNVALNIARSCTRDACSTADTAPALEWLTRTRGVKIVNLSFGAYFPEGTGDPVLEQAISDARARGALITASSGDNGESVSNHYPSCYEGVVGVGSVDADGALSSFSTRGPCVDLVAPGRSVVTTFDPKEPPGTPYAGVHGTSFSAPQAAGVAALVKARLPNLTADAIAQRMFSNATDKGPAGRDDSFGHGLLNADCAVSPGETGC